MISLPLNASIGLGTDKNAYYCFDIHRSDLAIFFRLKLLPWNQYWGTLLSVIGIVLLAVVVGLLNFFTPSGRITVQGTVVEITPNV